MILGLFFLNNLKAQNDPTNLNFENWNGIEPAGWTSSNDLSMDGGGAQTVFKETSNPGEGSASLKLVTGSCPECENYSLLFLPLPFPNPVGGFIQLGSIGEDGVAYTKRPVSCTKHIPWAMMPAVSTGSSPSTTPPPMRMSSSGRPILKSTAS